MKLVELICSSLVSARSQAADLANVAKGHHCSEQMMCHKTGRALPGRFAAGAWSSSCLPIPDLSLQWQSAAAHLVKAERAWHCEPEWICDGNRASSSTHKVKRALLQVKAGIAYLITASSPSTDKGRREGSCQCSV